MANELDRMIWHQDSNEVLDYAFDWSEWLPSGDTVSVVALSATPGIDVSAISHSDTKVQFWVSGGVIGSTYEVTVQVTTTQGRVGERTAFFKVVDR